MVLAKPDDQSAVANFDVRRGTGIIGNTSSSEGEWRDILHLFHCSDKPAHLNLAGIVVAHYRSSRGAEKLGTASYSAAWRKAGSSLSMSSDVRWRLTNSGRGPSSGLSPRSI